MTDAISPTTLQFAPPDLALDLWRPEGVARGLVVHAHGGGFKHGNRNDRIARHYGPRLAADGIAFASLSYRKGGAPRRVFDANVQARIGDAAADSQAFYPEIRDDLLGYGLYRATVDYHRAAAFLHENGFAGLPWVAMGNSSGALAAMGVGHGLLGLDLPGIASPAKVIGIAAVAPQPAQLGKSGPPVALLTARGDQVFPRAAVYRLADMAKAQNLPLEIEMIPFGQHTRPIREVLPKEDGTDSDWAGWLLDQIADVMPVHEG